MTPNPPCTARTSVRLARVGALPPNIPTYHHTDTYHWSSMDTHSYMHTYIPTILSGEARATTPMPIRKTAASHQPTSQPRHVAGQFLSEDYYLVHSSESKSDLNRVKSTLNFYSYLPWPVFLSLIGACNKG